MKKSMKIFTLTLVTAAISVIGPLLTKILLKEKAPADAPEPEEEA